MHGRLLRILLALLGLAAALALAAAAARAQAAPAGRPPGTARVTYLAGGSVYVDAGRAEGLHEGDTLTVSRAAAPATLLRAAFLSTHRAVCDTLPGSALPAVGDVARFVPRPDAAAEAPADSARAPAPLVPQAVAPPPVPAPMTPFVPNPPRASRLRGRVGARLLAIQSREAGDFTQPSLDARIDALSVGGSPFDLVADVRGRQTTRTLAGGGRSSDASTRVYRLATSLHDARAYRRLTLGRQSSPLLSSVNLFDGALAEWGGPRWSVGAFGGVQPDPVNLGLSGDVMQSGGFFEARQRPLAATRWSVAFGGVTSTDRGQVNRDFLFTQGYWRARGLSGAFAQEVDVQRGWRRERSGSALSFTSTFLTVRAQLAPWAELNGGYDGRRNVLLYRDRETPETAFDDRFREGAWAGTSFDLGRHVRLGGDLRTLAGGTDHATTWSANGEAMRIGPMNARLRARWSASRGDLARTDLASVGLGLDPFDGTHLEVGGGTRTTTDPFTGSRDRATWSNTDLDVGLLRRLLFSLSWEHTAGDFEHVDQEYAGLSWRF